ncbi:MAG: alpha-1,2-fucosyltransferase [Chlamydiia bacterium]|nr:alpha-1,2-fucosyltransferase [Chlamydiia bacterium]
MIRFAIFIISITCALQGRPFVTAHLNGQLGNQMYQIAVATAVALDNDMDVMFPELKTRTEFDIHKNYEHVLSRVCADEYPEPMETVYTEPKHYFVPIPVKPNMQLKGFFQSYKYFDHHRETLLALYAPSLEIEQHLLETFPKLFIQPCSVAVHVRTYNKEDPRHRNFATCPPSYFKEAMSRFPKNAVFYVFSDDIFWCKKHFAKFPYKIEYIQGNSHWIDFYLISACKHQIISNSTFSWWAAYLNDNPKKIVVAPKKWFAKFRDYDNRDIVPDSWIALDN